MDSNNKKSLYANYSFKESADLIGIKEESIVRIFTKYIHSFEGKINLLKTHINNNDFKSTTELAHSLKGSSANLNLPSLPELFRTIELGSKAQEQLSYKNELENISTIYSQLKEKI